MKRVEWVISNFSESYVAATINYEIIKRDPGILILRNLTVNDQMTIQCNATNKYGYVFTNTAIYIRGNLGQHKIFWYLLHIS